MRRELNYTRKFIILKTQYSNMKDLKPKGHGKLQGRGQNIDISFNIQGAEATNYYDILFIGRNKAHRVGSIYTEENSSGNAEFTLSQKDLDSWGFPPEGINGILIIRNSNILLGGYFQKDDYSIDKYISSMEDQDLVREDHREDEPRQEEVFEDDVLESEQEEVFEDNPLEGGQEENYTENLTGNLEEYPIEDFHQAYLKEDIGPENLVDEESVGEEIHPEETIYEESGSGEVDLPSDRLVDEADTMKKATIDGQEYYALDVEDIISTEEYSEALEEVFPEGQYPDPDFYENFHLPEKLEDLDITLDYILNILNYFPYIEPFRMNLRGYSWWKIDLEGPDMEQGFLPYFDYILNRDYNNLMIENSVTSSQLIKKYGHYIFGLFENKDGVKLYVYGIPGGFRLSEYPQAGTTGFNTWFEGRFKEKEAPGYWLLYLEANSGRILYPINPMIPME